MMYAGSKTALVSETGMTKVPQRLNCILLVYFSTNVNILPNDGAFAFFKIHANLRWLPHDCK